MIEEFGDKVTDAVALNLEDITQDQKEIIRYTVSQLSGELIKLVIMTAIAIFFEIGQLLIVAIFSMAIYRVPSGGAHSKGHISCFITSSMVFFGNIIVSMLARGQYLDYIYVLIFLINIPIIHVFAPADTEMKPIISKKLRLSLKIISYIAMTGMIVGARFLINDVTVRNIFIFGTLIQSLTMLPFMYKLMGTRYGLRDGITEPQI